MLNLKKKSLTFYENKKVPVWQFYNPEDRRLKEVWCFLPVKSRRDVAAMAEIIFCRNESDKDKFLPGVDALETVLVQASAILQSRKCEEGYRYYGLTTTSKSLLCTKVGTSEMILQSPDEEKPILEEASQILGSKYCNYVCLRLKKYVAGIADSIWLLGLASDDQNPYASFDPNASKKSDFMDDTVYHMMPFTPDKSVLGLPCPVRITNAPHSFEIAKNRGCPSHYLNRISCIYEEIDFKEVGLMVINLGHPTMGINQVGKAITHVCGKHKLTPFSKKVLPLLTNLQNRLRKSEVLESDKVIKVHLPDKPNDLSVIWSPLLNSKTTAPFAWWKERIEDAEPDPLWILESVTIYCKPEDLGMIMGQVFEVLFFGIDLDTDLLDCTVKELLALYKPDRIKPSVAPLPKSDETKIVARALGTCQECQNPVTDANARERVYLSCGKHALYYHKTCWRKATLCVKGKSISANSLKFKFVDKTGTPMGCVVDGCGRQLEEVEALGKTYF